MSTLTLPISPPSALAATYAAASKAPETRRAYGQWWKKWRAWSQGAPATPELVADWLAAVAANSKSASTPAVAAAALKAAFRLADIPLDWGSPRLVMVREGIRRTAAPHPPQKASPVTAERLALMVAGATPRDRAALLTGFSAALRGSELASLRWDAISVTPEGALIRLGVTKTDQHGTGTHLALTRNPDRSLCPVAALEALPMPRLGWVFCGNKGKAMNRRTLDRIVKAAAARADLEGAYSSHSLRAGFITTAYQKGVGLDRIQRHARHKSPRTTAGYVREIDAWKDTPTDEVWR